MTIKVIGSRINQYRYVDRLRDNAIYCDTDSVIYIQPRDEPAMIETDVKLVDMNSKLRTSEFIFEFASGGRKNYRAGL